MFILGCQVQINPAMSINNILLWICRIVAALILLQTLFFKFSASPESVYIFSQVHIEPWGRIGIGILELIASILLLIPRTSVFGALLALGLMVGAIITHIFIIGIEVMGDGGLLFIYSLVVLLASAYILWSRRDRLLAFVSRLATR